MSGWGFHWSPCRGGGGGDGLLSAAAVVIIVLILWAAYGHAAEDAAADVLHVLEIAGMISGSVLVAGGSLWAALAIRKRHRAALLAATADRPALPQQWQAAARAARRRTAEDHAEPPAIAPHQELHIHIHGDVAAGQVAELRRVIRGD